MPNHICLGCGKQVKQEHSVKCGTCQLWCHKACTGLSDETYKFLIQMSKDDGIDWTCRPCKHFARGLMANIKKIQDRLDLVEERQNNDHEAILDMQKKVVDIEQKMTDNNYSGNDNKVVMNEMRERELRKKNIIIHGVDEPPSQISPPKKREYDLKKVNEILHELGLSSDAHPIRFAKRLGMRKDTARPILIGFEISQSAEIVLSRSSLLRESSGMSNIRLVKDLTPTQRQEEKDLIEQANSRNADPTEENVTKNLEWRVVGRPGEKRLLRLPVKDPQQPATSGANAIPLGSANRKRTATASPEMANHSRKTRT